MRYTNVNKSYSSLHIVIFTNLVQYSMNISKQGSIVSIIIQSNIDVVSEAES